MCLSEERLRAGLGAANAIAGGDSEAVRGEGLESRHQEFGLIQASINLFAGVIVIFPHKNPLEELNTSMISLKDWLRKF